jgi:DNA replicative helicase MCM subunit Mcm2 (Cdc46/Mcm family)
MRSHPNYEEGEEDLELMEGVKMSEEEPNSIYGQESMDDTIELIDQALLKKYIAYARSNVKPVLHDVDSEKVMHLMLHMMFTTLMLLFIIDCLVIC